MHENGACYLLARLQHLAKFSLTWPKKKTVTDLNFILHFQGPTPIIISLHLPALSKRQSG
jgi:hypothetical protein